MDRPICYDGPNNVVKWAGPSELDGPALQLLRAGLSNNYGPARLIIKSVPFPGCHVTKQDDVMLLLDDVMFNTVKIGPFESSATCIHHACFPVVERSATRILPRYT